MRFRPDGAVVWILAGALAACGGDGENDDLPDLDNTATFTVAADGGDLMANYKSGEQTVFCTRDAGWASLWIRMGRDRTNRGEDGPHLDIDVCSHDRGGTFTPQGARTFACEGGRTFDMFWHGEDRSVFTNVADAPNCELEIAADGDRLNGTFSCLGLEEYGGSGSLDILDGAFSCTETS